MNGPWSVYSEYIRHIRLCDTTELHYINALLEICNIVYTTQIILFPLQQPITGVHQLNLMHSSNINSSMTAAYFLIKLTQVQWWFS